jgi:hypothetical protein
MIPYKQNQGLRIALNKKRGIIFKIRSMTSVVTKMFGYAKFLQINIPEDFFF